MATTEGALEAALLGVVRGNSSTFASHLEVQGTPRFSLHTSFPHTCCCARPFLPFLPHARSSWQAPASQYQEQRRRGSSTGDASLLELATAISSPAHDPAFHWLATPLDLHNHVTKRAQDLVQHYRLPDELRSAIVAEVVEATIGVLPITPQVPRLLAQAGITADADVAREVACMGHPWPGTATLPRLSSSTHLPAYCYGFEAQRRVPWTAAEIALLALRTSLDQLSTRVAASLLRPAASNPAPCVCYRRRRGLQSRRLCRRCSRSAPAGSPSPRAATCPQPKGSHTAPRRHASRCSLFFPKRRLTIASLPVRHSSNMWGEISCGSCKKAHVHRPAFPQAAPSLLHRV